MILPVVDVQQEGRRISPRLHGLHPLLVAFAGLKARNVVEPPDLHPGNPGGLGGDLLPASPVVLAKPSMAVAVQVAHLVDKGVAELLLRAVIEQGYLDADSPAGPPVELAERTARVEKRNLHGGQLTAEKIAVVLVEPSLQLFQGRCHIACVLLRTGRKPLR